MESASHSSTLEEELQETVIMRGEEREPASSPADTEEDVKEIPEVDSDDVEEILEPKINPVERSLIDAQGREQKYVQKPLHYFAKMQLYGVLGRAVDTAMSGDNPLDLDQMLEATKPQSLLDQLQRGLPGADTAPDRVDAATADVGTEQAGRILATFARVLSFMPEYMKEIYCLALDIPKGHWNWAINHGFETLSDEEGDDIFETFIDQNWEAIERFFTEKLPRHIRRVRKARERSLSARSKH